MAGLPGSYLDRLIRLVDVDNQSLRQAVANYRQARALVASAQAALYPTVIGAPSITRAGSGSTVRTSESLVGQASWQLDLFGGTRRTIESEAALAQSDAATIALTRLTIQAEVAADYLTVRYADSLQKVLDENVENFRKTAQITENQYAAGVAARSDVITAQTQVQTIEAQAIAVRLTRVQYVNAIATLIGRPPSEVSIPVSGISRNPPAVPVGIPGDLLERRPDVAQAERLVQAQSERIGVAVAAFFPTVTISAQGGVSGLTRTGLFSAANQFWSVAGSATEVLFDGGARTAALRSAEAAYDAQVANYRQVVLAAYAEVENQMAALRILGQQQTAQDKAVELSRKAVEITLNEYRAGTQNFTTVVTAQGLLVTNEINALQVRLSRFTAAVTLIRALGGGWDVRSPPQRLRAEGPEPADRPGRPGGPARRVGPGFKRDKSLLRVQGRALRYGSWTPERGPGSVGRGFHPDTPPKGSALWDPVGRNGPPAGRVVPPVCCTQTDGSRRWPSRRRRSRTMRPAAPSRRHPARW